MLVDAKSLSKQPVFSVRCRAEWSVRRTVRLPSNELFCIFISPCCGARNAQKPRNPIRNLSTSDPRRRTNSGPFGYKLNLRPKLINVSLDSIHFVLNKHLSTFFFLSFPKSSTAFANFTDYSVAASLSSIRKENVLSAYVVFAQELFFWTVREKSTH